jgi:dolichyl-phosphate-mannose--protein O-mannosyl transferase
MGKKNNPLITWIIGRRATYCFGTLAQHDTPTRSICWKMLLALKKKLSKNFLPKLVYMSLLCLVFLPFVVCYIICYNCKVKLTLID